MTLTLYLSFVAAAGLLAIIPGPGVLFVLAQTTKGGKAAGISASFGTGIGGNILAVFSSIFFMAQLRKSRLTANSFKYISSASYFGLGLMALKAAKAKARI